MSTVGLSILIQHQKQLKGASTGGVDREIGICTMKYSYTGMLLLSSTKKQATDVIDKDESEKYYIK